jgi:glutamate N-acetyltransferase/amino-acid N-acetyltransferase
MKTIAGGVTAPRGFQCAGVACGVKTQPGARDVGLVVSDAPATAAGVFTTNRIASPTIILDRERLGRRKMRGVVVNAGNANACTGRRGVQDAVARTELAALAVGARAVEFFVASTGLIGRRLPMDKITAGIAAAGDALGRTRRHNDELAAAVMTTDLTPKTAAVTFRLGKRQIRVGGVAKGSGMIAPDMATMLAFITTDGAVSAPLLRKALREVTAQTFNAVTVDGDCSTNDAVFLLANGAAGNTPIARAGRNYDAFVRALRAVCERLATAIARDGEGATKLLTVKVTGARSEADAKRVARAIAESPLVKTAAYGEDPNWGRIICAAGHSGAPVVSEKMRLTLNDLLLFSKGRPTNVAPERRAACMKPDEIRIKLHLGQGKGAATMWTCDLSREYVAINAEYST